MVRKIGQVAGDDLEAEAVIRPVAERAHHCLGLGTALLHVGVVARELLHHLRRHCPLTFGGGQQRRSDVTLTIAEYVYEGLAIKRERDCVAEFWLIEWRLLSDR